MVGRTSLLEPMVTHAEVDDLQEVYGSVYYGAAVPVSQRLDLIATEILRVDRLENVSHKHSDRKDYLSPTQMHGRMQREDLRGLRPFENLEAIDVWRGKGPREQDRFRRRQGWVEDHSHYQSREGGCEIEEAGEICGLKIEARRMCGKHHRRWSRHGDPLYVSPRTNQWTSQGRKEERAA